MGSLPGDCSSHDATSWPCCLWDRVLSPRPSMHSSIHCHPHPGCCRPDMAMAVWYGPGVSPCLTLWSSQRLASWRLEIDSGQTQGALQLCAALKCNLRSNWLAWLDLTIYSHRGYGWDTNSRCIYLQQYVQSLCWWDFFCCQMVRNGELTDVCSSNLRV